MLRKLAVTSGKISLTGSKLSHTLIYKELIKIKTE